MIPTDLKYTKEHEWIKVEGTLATVGITDHAQSELGDIVFVEMPEVGSKLKAMGEFGVVESVKTVSNLYAPVTGTVEAINEALADTPESINSDPYGNGWIMKVSMDNPAEIDKLLDSAGYKKIIAG